MVTRLQQMAEHPHPCDGADGHPPEQSAPVDIADLQAARETILQLQLQLEVAVAHRTVIGQATGIVMERFDVDSTAAFDALAELSQQTNRKLYEISRELVSGRDFPELRRLPSVRRDR